MTRDRAISLGMCSIHTCRALDPSFGLTGTLYSVNVVLSAPQNLQLKKLKETSHLVCKWLSARIQCSESGSTGVELDSTQVCLQREAGHRGRPGTPAPQPADCSSATNGRSPGADGSRRWLPASPGRYRQRGNWHRHTTWGLEPGDSVIVKSNILVLKLAVRVSATATFGIFRPYFIRSWWSLVRKNKDSFLRPEWLETQISFPQL